jgi:hypothetical protein
VPSRPSEISGAPAFTSGSYTSILAFSDKGNEAILPLAELL